jgi:serine protease Do
MWYKKNAKYLYGFMMLVLIVVFTMAGLAVPAHAAQFDLNNSTVVADIAEKSSPTVVWIITTFETQSTNRMFFRNQPKKEYQSQGSGFFFNSDGFILTNAHVVEGAKNIEVILKDQKEPINASLIGIDTDLDVAVIKVDLPYKTPFLKLGDSD